MASDVLVAAALVALVAILLWRRPWRRRGDEILVMEAWLETFSPAAYLPMLRLSEPDDTGFLKTMRGPEAALQYRRLQRRMLREYLRGLSRDFHRLHCLATETAVREGSDHGDFSLALVEEKMEFVFSVWSIELRLLLSEVAPFTVDLRPLLANVDRLTARAREIARRRHDLRLS